jgi:hypothetical protein
MASMNCGVGSGDPSRTSTSSTVTVPAVWPIVMSRRISSTGRPSSAAPVGPVPEGLPAWSTASLEGWLITPPPPLHEEG